MDVKLILGNVEREVRCSSNVIAEKTIKNAFLLPHDAIVSLYYKLEEKEYCCEADLTQKNQPGILLPEKCQTFEVKSDKNPSPEASPADVTGPARKRRKLDFEVEQPQQPVDGDLISQICPYAWFYRGEEDEKKCAIPLTNDIAITYSHGTNLEVGNEVKLYQYHDEHTEVKTTVVMKNKTFDLLVLQSKTGGLSDIDLLSYAVEPKKGMQYTLMGFSVKHSRTTHISFSTGIIASDITPRNRYLGTSGSFKGDSGGSCWNNDGRLIGMQVEVEKVRHTEDEKHRPTSPACGGRCAIVPINLIRCFISDLLPPPEEDYDEDS